MLFKFGHIDHTSVRFIDAFLSELLTQKMAELSKRTEIVDEPSEAQVQVCLVLFTQIQKNETLVKLCTDLNLG